MNQSKPNQITPEYVLNMSQPAKGYLCPMEANVYGVEFVHFRIRNYETDEALIEITKRPQDIGKQISQASRTVRYNFGPYFFMLKIIGTTLKFKVGPKPIKNFRLIQRHYFKNKLIKSYEFPPVFCMPSSTNTMQAIYQLPDLSEEQIEQMIASPWQTVGDSFFFADNQLIMHTKAQFSYAGASTMQQEDDENEE